MQTTTPLDRTTLVLELPAETAAALAALCVREGYPDRTLEQVVLDLIEKGLWAEGAGT
jgi:hypothetical protein